MGMDPLTIGLITAGVGAGVGAIGDARAQGAANRQQGRVNSAAMGMMMPQGSSPYEAMIQKLIGGLGDPMRLDPTSGNIDMAAIMQRMNPGQDALMQFLRADPMSKLLGESGGTFDASRAFGMLEGNDALQIERATNATRAGFSGLGSRFGTAAMRNEGRMRSDFAAQIAARNAGIAQSSFESNAARRLAAAQGGMGFQLQGAQALASQGVNAAQIAAGLATANQDNLYRNNAFNLSANQQNYMQRLNAIQAGFGINQQGFQNNRDLLAIMAGLNPGGGTGFQAVGQGMGDIGQLLMFLPFMRNAGNRSAA